MSSSLLYPVWAYPPLWVPPRRPRLTPKENSHHTKAGSEVTGSLFLVKPLVLGDARLCESWVFTHLVGVDSLHTIAVELSQKGNRMDRSPHTEKPLHANQD